MSEIFKKWTSLLLLATGLMFPSCFDAGDYDFNRVSEVKWNPEYAVPLLYGSVGIRNFLNKEDSTFVREKEDGSLYLLFEDTLETRNLNELAVIPNHSLNRVYGSPVGLTINPGESQTIEENGIVDLRQEPELAEEELFQAIINGGDISYSVNSALSNSVNADISVVFPTIRNQSGDSLKILVTLVENGLQSESGTKALSGYTMDFTTLDAGYNQLPYTFKAVIHSGSNQLNLPVGNFFNLNIGFYDIKYDFITGYFGQQEVTLPDDLISFGLTGDAFGEMQISLAEAAIELEAVNEYGVPGIVVFNAFEARRGTEKMDLVLSQAGGIPIAAPSSPGQSATTQVHVVNAAEIFNFRPDELYYSTTASINPDGRPQNDNFMLDSSLLKVRFRAEAPLYGSATGISLTDTLELSLGEDFEEAEVEKALLKVKISNEFPLEADVQVYFADENYQLLDSLFEEDQKKIIVACDIDAGGSLVPGGAGVYDEVIIVDKARFNHLLDTKYLLVHANMSTKKTGNGYPDVRLKADYKLSVEMGIQTKFNLTYKP